MISCCAGWLSVIPKTSFQNPPHTSAISSLSLTQHPSGNYFIQTETLILKFKHWWDWALFVGTWTTRNRSSAFPQRKNVLLRGTLDEVNSRVQLLRQTSVSQTVEVNGRMTRLCFSLKYLRLLWEISGSSPDLPTRDFSVLCPKECKILPSVLWSLTVTCVTSQCYIFKCIFHQISHFVVKNFTRMPKSVTRERNKCSDFESKTSTEALLVARKSLSTTLEFKFKRKQLP